MGTDERNFRSAYYEKVGFKSVEEKKSLEILLKEKHLDIPKLKQFCLRFAVPFANRNLVWKLLLGVLPLRENCRGFVESQRKEEYSNLIHALEIMRLIDNKIPKEPETFVLMWLLQVGHLNSGLHLDKEKALLAIVKSLILTTDTEFDIYWISKGLYDIVQKFQCEIPRLIEATHNLLDKEDSTLYRHLTQIDGLEKLPLHYWFNCCFAGVLSDIALGKIWDKLCAGSYKILIYVAVVILTSVKRELMKCNNLEEVLANLETVSEDAGELIVNKAIDLWQQQGSPLTVYDKPKPQVL